jgi:Flp pilus assembly protein TadG
VIEFVFVALVVLLPLVYFVVAVAVVQRSRLAVAHAAREAGRAFASSPDASAVEARMEAAIRLAFAGQGVPDDATVRFVVPGAACSGPSVVPSLVPGARFTVCVTRRVRIPAVPALFAGRGVTTVGRYTVYVDDYRQPPQ